MKKTLLTFILTIGCALQAQDAGLGQKNFTPQETVVALDLHDVVLDLSIRKVISTLYGFLVSNPSHTLTLPINPLCWLRIYHILHDTPWAAEAIYDQLTARYYPGLAHSKTAFLHLCNPYDLNPHMAELINKLKKNNYRLAVCSNAGEQVFNASRQQYQGFFDKFDVIGLSAAPDYLRKPNQEFFEAFKQKCHQELGQEELLFYFFDDKLKNAEAAKKAGMVGFVFKEPQRFKSDLLAHGIKID